MPYQFAVCLSATYISGERTVRVQMRFLMPDDLFSGTLDPSSTPEKQSCEFLTSQIFWLATSCT